MIVSLFRASKSVSLLLTLTPPSEREREFLIDNLLVRIHYVIVLIR